MKKLSLAAIAVSTMFILPSCSSESEQEGDMSTETMSETSEMEMSSEGEAMMTNKGTTDYTEVEYVSEFPLADTVLKYSSQGFTGARLTEAMSVNAKGISENLDGRASVLQYGEGIIVALDQGDIFESGEYKLNEKSKDVLRALAFNLKQMPETYILVAGRADSDGATEANDKLAYMRAATAANYLHGCGVEEDRFFVDSFGEKYPDFKNNSKLSKNKNRRVDFLIIPANSMREDVAMR
ncbi:OmpA family protein [Jiulongibacter sp. NS-SX5]|uniref:OmpA family protein n=1 Tax=Jiulongibacter sp. NS-SX5 TaxID=3463854 RepID=UPI004059BC03